MDLRILSKKKIGVDMVERVYAENIQVGEFILSRHHFEQVVAVHPREELVILSFANGRTITYLKKEVVERKRNDI